MPIVGQGWLYFACCMPFPRLHSHLCKIRVCLHHLAQPHLPFNLQSVTVSCKVTEKQRYIYGYGYGVGIMRLMPLVVDMRSEIEESGSEKKLVTLLRPKS